jgi:hypothetical protein
MPSSARPGAAQRLVPDLGAPHRQVRGVDVLHRRIHVRRSVAERLDKAADVRADSLGNLAAPQTNDKGDPDQDLASDQATLVVGPVGLEPTTGGLKVAGSGVRVSSHECVSAGQRILVVRGKPGASPPVATLLQPLTRSRGRRAPTRVGSPSPAPAGLWRGGNTAT